jgi:osmoprotectant transport system permease protein
MVRNRVLLVLVVVGAAAAIWLPFLRHAPNRLLSGRPVGLATAVADQSWSAQLFCCAVAAVLLVSPFLPPKAAVHRSVSAAALGLIVSLFVAAGLAATKLAAGAPPAARTSLSVGFWVLLLCAALVLADAHRRSGRSVASGCTTAALLAVCVAVAAGSGVFDELSLAKELANRRDVFEAAVLRHIELVALALLPSVGVGVPLGILAHRKARSRASIFPVLNIVQTIPSIALFALLIGPLSALAAAAPALRDVGIAGVGAAPAVVALVVYSLLPIARATAEGLAGVPRDAVEAGQGIGMTPSQLFWRVELPLAMPVILAGLRVTTVQAIGLAAVAALIGAGGLGALMFQGVYANALDLVLLGTIPVILLALAADVLFRLLAAEAEGSRR